MQRFCCDTCRCLEDDAPDGVPLPATQMKRSVRNVAVARSDAKLRLGCFAMLSRTCWPVFFRDARPTVQTH